VRVIAEPSVAEEALLATITLLETCAVAYSANRHRNEKMRAALLADFKVEHFKAITGKIGEKAIQYILAKS
jgi:hypothetical protein